MSETLTPPETTQATTTTTAAATSKPAAAGGTFRIGGNLEVTRLGYGAMQITGPGIWAARSSCARARR